MSDTCAACGERRRISITHYWVTGERLCRPCVENIEAYEDSVNRDRFTEGR